MKKSTLFAIIFLATLIIMLSGVVVAFITWKAIWLLSPIPFVALCLRSIIIGIMATRKPDKNNY